MAEPLNSPGRSTALGRDGPGYCGSPRPGLPALAGATARPMNLCSTPDPQLAPRARSSTPPEPRSPHPVAKELQPAVCLCSQLGLHPWTPVYPPPRPWAPSPTPPAPPIPRAPSLPAPPPQRRVCYLVAGPGDVHPARRAHLLGEGSVPASLAPHCPCRPRRALRHRPGERSLPRPRSRVPVRPPQRPQAGHRPGCSRPEGLVASFSFKGAMAATLLGPERLGVGGRG